MRRRLVRTTHWALFVLLWTGAAAAEPGVGTLTLDGLSFISFGDRTVLPIEPGATIEFEFGEEAADGSVPFTIQPGGVSIPAIPLSGGGSLHYAIAQAASGTLRVEQDGGEIDFTATVQATTIRPEGQGTYHYAMPFTTETVQAVDIAGSQPIEVTGMRLVDGVWYVQLVGAATNRDNAFPEPGAAVYTILSGTFDQIP